MNSMKVLKKIVYSFIRRPEEPNVALCKQASRGVSVKFWFLCVLLYARNACSLGIKLELYDVQNPDQGVNAIVYTGEQFGVKIELTDIENDTGSVGLEVVGLDQFHGIGQNLSKSYMSVNGKTTMNLVQEYTLSAEREGVFTIGPARATHQDKQYASHSFTIRVIKRPANSQPGAPGNTGQKSGKDEFFCKLVAQKKSVFIHEPIEINLLIYHSANVHDFGFAKQPVFAGFKVKEVVQMTERQEVIDGKPYIVKDKKFVLFPSKQGTHTVEPVHFAYNIPATQKRSRGNGFFDDAFIQAMIGHQLEQKRTVSNSLNITVKPLPEQIQNNLGNNSSNKNVDAVGNFTGFSATIDKHDPVANEPVILTLEFAGKTDFDRLAAPKLRLPKSMKFYASKTDIQEDFTVNYVGGKKKFDFVVQISQPGTWEIPAQELSYFDTISQTYKVLKTQPITLTVAPAPDEKLTHTNQKDMLPQDNQDNQDEPDNNPSEPKNIAHDINFIEDDIQAVHRNKITSIPWWLLILLLFIPIFVARILIVRQFFDRMITRVRFGSSKTQHLFIVTKNKLQELEKKSNAKPLYNLMIQFLAVKFGIDHDEVTEHWLEIRLAQDGWSRDKVEEFITYLHDCAGLYFSSLGLSESQQRDLLKRASYWLMMLNK